MNGPLVLAKRQDDLPAQAGSIFLRKELREMSRKKKRQRQHRTEATVVNLDFGRYGVEVYLPEGMSIEQLFAMRERITKAKTFDEVMAAVRLLVTQDRRSACCGNV